MDTPIVLRLNKKFVTCFKKNIRIHADRIS